MKFLPFALILFCSTLKDYAQPVLKNPGILESESYEIYDYINTSVGFVTAKVYSSLKERNGKKYYYINVKEGDIFSNEIELNYSDLTTISEKRVDLRTNSVVEYYSNYGDNIIHFFNKEYGLDKNFSTDEKNIYSRYAYFFSFSGFPFESEKDVTFKSYMCEYGNALTMRVTNVGKEMVSVKAGTFECYKLELAVAGWQSIFASDKYYFYFSVNKPHHFVKYEEEDNGQWYADELIREIK